ncbi:hypothetical protein FVA74_10365 [Salinibacterium sp. dk2585]|uniref:hypothetical protein n=1 Tax=unclassified Salinibacterium TaxID=2632331 RepID=UPI0011C24E1F|nr:MULTISPECIES: hypothetical protein [unclassified Salinibacterium]QEE61927.1 hypothetical protein FVA74_10365 [Salinibacterium sp. dk2585]TXK54518.1 hypothetical protein FVP63_05595 [Salinibacterium sp. dk5596]
MSFLVFAAALLAVFFLWGLISPRTQWRVLGSWLRRNPDASEPGATAYAFHRILSGLGVGTFLTIAVVAVMSFIDSLPAPEPPKTALQQMWGTAPSPVVVDRVVQSADVANPSFASQPILGYQPFDNTRHQPRYLVYLDTYDVPGASEALIGREPTGDFAALDSAELVLNVRVKPQCAPVEAVVIETAEVVQVSISSAIASPVGGDAVSHDFCAGGSTVGPSLLIPIDLTEPLGERVVQTLDGTEVRRVPVIEPR